MGNVFLVHVADTFQNLLHELNGFRLCEVLFLSDEIKELSTLYARYKKDKINKKEEWTIDQRTKKNTYSHVMQTFLLLLNIVFKL